jgi:hypothetical protein
MYSDYSQTTRTLALTGAIKSKLDFSIKILVFQQQGHSPFSPSLPAFCLLSGVDFRDFFSKSAAAATAPPRKYALEMHSGLK